MCAQNSFNNFPAQIIQTVKIPPDGNWGWAVMIGFAIFNFIYLTTIYNFGLIYGGKIEMIELSIIEMIMVMNINGACATFLVILAGPLISQFGYRFVALAGGVAITSGIILSSFSHNFMSFLITYGIVAGCGFGISLAAIVLAFDSYFVDKKNKAKAIAITLATIGPIFYPSFLGYILDLYGVIGCILIVGSISSHVILAAILLEPLEWHLKKIIEIVNTGRKFSNSDEIDEVPSRILQGQNPVADIGLSNRYNRVKSIDQDTIESNHSKKIPPRIESKWSFSDIEAFASLLFCSEAFERIYNYTKQEANDPGKIKMNERGYEEVQTRNERLPKAKRSFFKISVFWTIKLFDKNLLQSKIFLMTIIGMSASVFGDTSFTFLTPFILNFLNYSRGEIIIFMTITPIFDLIFHLLSQAAENYWKIRPKRMFMISLILTAIVRFVLLKISSFEHLLVLAFFIGLAKGIRLTYFHRVSPSFVSKDKIAAMAGIQLITNGTSMILFGLIISWLQHLTGEFSYTVVILSILPLLHFFILAIEMIHTQYYNIDIPVSNGDD